MKNLAPLDSVGRSEQPIAWLIHRDNPLGFLDHAPRCISLDYPPLTDEEVGFIQGPKSSMKSAFSDQEPRAVLPVAVTIYLERPALLKVAWASEIGGVRFWKRRGSGEKSSFVQRRK